MTPRIRILDPRCDRGAVRDLFLASADYVRLERDEEPGEELVDEFFGDVLPDRTLNDMRKLGMEATDGSGRLVAVAELGFGYPEPGDAYLGLLQLAETERGGGLGAIFLREMERIAREGGAERLYLAVLHANRRGRAFWEREGFRLAVANREVTLGSKTQLADRLVKDL